MEHCTSPACTEHHNKYLHLIWCMIYKTSMNVCAIIALERFTFFKIVISLTVVS